MATTLRDTAILVPETHSASRPRVALTPVSIGDASSAAVPLRRRETVCYPDSGTGSGRRWTLIRVTDDDVCQRYVCHNM